MPHHDLHSDLRPTASLHRPVILRDAGTSIVGDGDRFGLTRWLKPESLLRLINRLDHADELLLMSCLAHWVGRLCGSMGRCGWSVVRLQGQGGSCPAQQYKRQNANQYRDPLP